MEERLQKYLARAGVASRRAAELLITGGRVAVNNKVVRELGTKVEPGRDLVQVDGRNVSVADERQYFIFHKPPGVVTTLKDPQGRQTISDFLGQVKARVFPVGRLDYDAEGALLLTDDGDLANRLMHPRHEVPRVYLAKVKGEPTAASLEKLVAGVRLEDGPARAQEVSVYEKAERNTWLRLVVTEGRPHLVKRLCAAIGHPCQRLFRPAHASISIDGVRPGTMRALTADEVRQLQAVTEGERFPEAPLRLPPRRHGRAGGHEASEEEPVEAAAPASRGPRKPGPARSTRR